MKLGCVFLASLIFISCSSSTKKIGEAQVGWQKADVLDAFGSPDRTWRSNGIDHWYYNPKSSTQEDRLILIFEEGRLVKKRRPGQDEDLEQLEKELKDLAPKPTGSFNTLSE